MEALSSSTAFASVVADGILTWALPLAVLIAVLVWYVLALRRHHPE